MLNILIQQAARFLADWYHHHNTANVIVLPSVLKVMEFAGYPGISSLNAIPIRFIPVNYSGFLQ